MATLRVKVDPAGAVSGAAVAEEAIDDIALSAQRSEAAVDRMGKSMGPSMGRASNASKGLAQQLSQVVDMGLATGQWGKAFFLQMSDIAMVLGGPMTIAAGAAIGVLGTLGLSFLNVGGEAEDSEEALESFLTSLDQVASLMDIANQPIADLRAEFGEFAEAVQRASETAARAALATALREFATAAPELRKGLTDVASASADWARELQKVAQLEQILGERTIRNASVFEEADRAVDAAAATLSEAAGVLGLTSLQAQQLDRALRDLASADGMEAIATEAANALDLIGGMFDETQNIPPEVAEIVLNLEEVLGAAAAGTAAMDDMGDGIGRAADQAERLSRALSYISGVNDNTVSGFGADDPRNPNGPIWTGGYSRTWEGDPSRRRSRTGGGGSAISELEQMERAYNSVRSSVDDTFRATQQYENAVEVLDNALAANIITQQEYNDALGMVKERFDEAQNGAADLSSSFNAIENSFEDNIMAMVDGTKTFAEGIKGMAKTVIAELYRVLVVQQMVGSFGSGGGAGTGLAGLLGGIFSGARAHGGHVKHGETYLVGERGPEPFTPTSDGYITPAGGGQGVNVEIHMHMQANGDESVKRILADSMPQVERAVTTSIISARRRGGAMKAAFG